MSITRRQFIQALAATAVVSSVPASNVFSADDSLYNACAGLWVTDDFSGHLPVVMPIRNLRIASMGDPHYDISFRRHPVLLTKILDSITEGCWPDALSGFSGIIVRFEIEIPDTPFWRERRICCSAVSAREIMRVFLLNSCGQQMLPAMFAHDVLQVISKDIVHLEYSIDAEHVKSRRILFGDSVDSGLLSGCGDSDKAAS